MTSLYDQIGAGYALTRRPDPRIGDQILQALGDSESVVNVGAGTGSYEPRDRTVIAVEPSATMIRQRPPGSAPAIRGTAERLSLVDCAVDSAIALLTVHHWTAPARGFAEMRRVARKRVVVFTWDPTCWESFWLVRDYFPISAVDRRRELAIPDIVAALGESQIVPVLIPHDCVDGLQGAFWRRPEAYLDARVRSAMSAFATKPPAELEEGLGRLSADLQSGDWEARHRDLLDLDKIDLGYRLIIATT